MSDRSRSFLQDNERDSVKEQLQQFEESDREAEADYNINGQIKYRIKDEVANEDDFIETICRFHDDLKLLSFFQYYIRDDGGGYEWEETVLPQAKPELKRLQDRLEHLIEVAEDSQTAHERAEIDEIIESTLYADMDFGRAFSTDAVEGNMVLSPPPEMPADAEEAQRRRDALLWILEKNWRTDILKYLYENGKSDLPDKQVDEGKKWGWYASRYLTEGEDEQKQGLVEREKYSNTYSEYSLTNRGNAVYNTWAELRDLPVVEDRIQEIKGVRDEQDAVLYLLKAHYSRDDIISQMFPTDEY